VGAREARDSDATTTRLRLALRRRHTRGDHMRDRKAGALNKRRAAAAAGTGTGQTQCTDASLLGSYQSSELWLWPLSLFVICAVIAVLLRRVCRQRTVQPSTKPIAVIYSQRHAARLCETKSAPATRCAAPAPVPLAVTRSYSAKALKLLGATNEEVSTRASSIAEPPDTAAQAAPDSPPPKAPSTDVLEAPATVLSSAATTVPPATATVPSAAAATATVPTPNGSSAAHAAIGERAEALRRFLPSWEAKQAYTPSQKAVMGAFRSALESEGLLTDWWDNPLVFARFCEARQFDLPKALEMFRSHLAWRKTVDLDEIVVTEAVRTCST
jgi:hypothetical protein